MDVAVTLMDVAVRVGREPIVVSVMLERRHVTVHQELPTRIAVNAMLVYPTLFCVTVSQVRWVRVDVIFATFVTV